MGFIQGYTRMVEKKMEPTTPKVQGLVFWAQGCSWLPRASATTLESEKIGVAHTKPYKGHYNISGYRNSCPIFRNSHVRFGFLLGYNAQAWIQKKA